MNSQRILRPKMNQLLQVFLLRSNKVGCALCSHVVARGRTGESKGEIVTPGRARRKYLLMFSVLGGSCLVPLEKDNSWNALLLPCCSAPRGGGAGHPAVDNELSSRDHHCCVVYHCMLLLYLL